MRKLIKLFVFIGFGVGVAKILRGYRPVWLRRNLRTAMKKSRKWYKGPYKKARRFVAEIQSKAQSVFA